MSAWAAMKGLEWQLEEVPCANVARANEVNGDLRLSFAKNWFRISILYTFVANC